MNQPNKPGETQVFDIEETQESLDYITKQFNLSRDPETRRHLARTANYLTRKLSYQQKEKEKE